jgi:hypothetical protein
MSFMNRMLRGIFVFTALFLTCISLTADWLLERGALSDSFDNCISLIEAQRKGEEFQRETQVTHKRLQVKSRIAEALTNGEMRLIDAAAFFRAQHEDPMSWHHPFRRRPDLEDGEGWCREVIEWTVRYASAQESPSKADELRHRLQKDLQKLVDRNGTLALPQ